MARAFAREGARLFLSGRSLPKVEAVAADILAGGGMAEVARVDALDEQAVEAYVSAVAEKAGLAFARTRVLNDDPAVFAALADRVVAASATLT